MSKRTTVAAMVALVMLSSPIAAQGVAGSAARAEGARLKGRHRVELGIGMLSKVSVSDEVTVGSITTRAEGNGVTGWIGYGYWLEDRMAVTVSAGAFDADASVVVSGGTFVESATVAALLFGMSFQPFQLTETDALRPYIHVGAGPHVGTSDRVTVAGTTSAESVSETVFGLRLAGGLDLSLGRRFVLGLNGGYRFMPDFDERIGSEKNYSSPEFSLVLGFLFGRGAG